MCGATAPADARFCPQCGTALGVDVVDLTGRPSGRSAAEAPDLQRRSPNASRLLVGLGAILVLAVAGLWLLSGDADAPEEERAAERETADEPAATDGTLPAAEQTLESVLSIRPSFAEVEELLRPDEKASVGLVRLGDTLFWLTGEYVESVWPATDLRVRDPRVRRSDDGGTTWTELSHDLPPTGAFGAVARSGDELALAGTDRDHALTVWRSSDGQSWTAESVADQDAAPGRIAIPTMLHDSPAGLIMLTTETPDFGILEPILPLDPSHLTAVIGGSLAERVDFVGPMGIRIEGRQLDDPAIDDEMRAAIDHLGDRQVRDPSGAIWTKGTDGWSGTTVDGQPNDVALLPDGSPLVIGFTGAGTTEWTIGDDGEWTNRFASPDLITVTAWRGQTIATGDGDLRVRNDRGSWDPFGLFNALPRTLQDGFLVSAAGDSDILSVSLISTREGRSITPPGPALLAKDGFVLTYDISFDNLVLTTPSDIRIDLALRQPFLPPGVTVDAAAPALLVEDPDSDARTSFSFTDLAQLERAASTLGSIFEVAEVLVSVDGQTWARGDLPEGSFATELLPAGDSVLTVVGRLGGPRSGLATDGVRLLRVSYS